MPGLRRKTGTEIYFKLIAFQLLTGFQSKVEVFSLAPMPAGLGTAFEHKGGPDAAALRQHAAQDRDTARASGIRCVRSGADFDDDAEAEGAVSAQRREKASFQGVAWPAGGETGPSRRRWKRRGPNPAETLLGKAI